MIDFSTTFSHELGGAGDCGKSCVIEARFGSTIAKDTLPTEVFGFNLMALYPIPSLISPTDDAQCLKEIFNVKSQEHFGYK